MESLEGQLMKVLKGSSNKGLRFLTAFHHAAFAVSENVHECLARKFRSSTLAIQA